MGLLDSLLGGLGRGGTGTALLDSVMSLVNDPHTGGLQGLVKTFQDRGMGGLVDSWVSTGHNLPVSADQIQAALGGDRLGSLAQGLGMSSTDLSAKLSELLPQVVDKLTPKGRIE